MTIEVEFWPDYGSGPLWLSGASIEPHSVLSSDLADRLIVWNSRYEEVKLPLDGAGDAEWLAQGKSLLKEAREQLKEIGTITVTEPWWD